MGDTLTGRELVHTSYFDHPEVLDLLATNIAWAIDGPQQLPQGNARSLALWGWFRQFKQGLGVVVPDPEAGTDRGGVSDRIASRSATPQCRIGVLFVSSVTIIDRAGIASSGATRSGELVASDRDAAMRRDMQSSLADGAGYGGMVGFGETYISAFALALGLGELMAGLAASLPMLAGGIMQTISPWAIRRMGSHKHWVVCCAAIQSLTFVPLFLAAWRGHLSGMALLWIAAVYWAAGLATGPAWNTWIGTVVPVAKRAGFLAVRTRASQAAVFLGFLLGGIALQWGPTAHGVLPTFAVLFAVAGLSRSFSVWMLWRTNEPNPIPSNMKTLGLARHSPPVVRRGAADAY